MIGNMRVAFAAVLAIFVFAVAIDGSGPAQAAEKDLRPPKPEELEGLEIRKKPLKKPFAPGIPEKVEKDLRPPPPGLDQLKPPPLPTASPPPPIPLVIGECVANNYSCPAGYNCVFLGRPFDRPGGTAEFNLFRCEPRPPAAASCPNGYELIHRRNDGSYRCRSLHVASCPNGYDIDRSPVGDGGYRCNPRRGNPSCAGVPQGLGGIFPPRPGQGGTFTCIYAG